MTGGPRSIATYSEGAPASMRGRVCVVTGATRGLGRATALGLARLGATVVLVARDAARGARTAEDLRAASGGSEVTSVVADLASFASIRGAAAEIRARHDAVHVLVNNAGVSTPRRRSSADGIELTLAVNVLAPFLLTDLLLPALRAGAPSRVIDVTSRFARLGRVDFADLQGTRRYSGDRAYMQSKLALEMFTWELAERLRDDGITANCVEPGLVATDLLRERWWWRTPWLGALWRRTFLPPHEGARAAIIAASSPELEVITGRCIDRHGRFVRTSPRANVPTQRRRLWQAAAELTSTGNESTAPPGSARRLSELRD